MFTSSRRDRAGQRTTDATPRAIRCSASPGRGRVDPRRPPSGRPPAGEPGAPRAPGLPQRVARRPTSAAHTQTRMGSHTVQGCQTVYRRPSITTSTGQKDRRQVLVGSTSTASPVPPGRPPPAASRRTASAVTGGLSGQEQGTHLREEAVAPRPLAAAPPAPADRQHQQTRNGAEQGQQERLQEAPARRSRRRTFVLAQAWETTSWVSSLAVGGSTMCRAPAALGPGQGAGGGV